MQHEKFTHVRSGNYTVGGQFQENDPLPQQADRVSKERREDGSPPGYALFSITWRWDGW
jgi:hypothetical protein